MNNQTAKDRTTVADEAAEWFLAMQEASPSRRSKEALLSWLLESPVHVREYLEVARLYSELETIDPCKELTVQDAPAANVVHLAAGEATAAIGEVTRLRRWGQRFARYRLAAGVLVAGLFAAVYYYHASVGQIGRAHV